MADDAIDWMYRIHQTNPEQPLFLYYVPLALPHAPHHPKKVGGPRFTRCTCSMTATKSCAKRSSEPAEARCDSPGSELTPLA